MPTAVARWLCGRRMVRHGRPKVRSTSCSPSVRLRNPGPTLSTVFDLDCDADVILGFPWLRSHGLAFVYEDSQVCFCAEAGCTSGRRVRMDRFARRIGGMQASVFSQIVQRFL